MRDRNDKSGLAIWAAASAFVLGLAAISTNREYQITPEALGDLNGDGRAEVFVFKEDLLTGTEFIGYVDGKQVRQEGDKYFARGGSAIIPGTATGYTCGKPGVVSRGIAAGNFDNDPRLDLKYVEVLQDFPLFSERVFMNIGMPSQQAERE